MDDDRIDESLRDRWELQQLNNRDQKGQPAESIYAGLLSEEAREQLRKDQEQEKQRRETMSPLELAREERKTKKEAETKAQQIVDGLTREEIAANDVDDGGPYGM